MIVVTNRIPVAAGHEKEFEDRFRNRAHLIDQSPGFIANRVMRPVMRIGYDLEANPWSSTSCATSSPRRRPAASRRP